MPRTPGQPQQHGSYLMPSLEHATVADAMHPGILSCAPDTSLTEVARMMVSNHVHSIVVVDESGGEPLVRGIVSDLDIVRAGIQSGAEQTAVELAVQPLVKVELTTPLRDAGELMLKHGTTHVVVIDPAARRPVGVLSTLDIAGLLAWGEG
jgi:CBS domain-containing protein